MVTIQGSVAYCTLGADINYAGPRIYSLEVQGCHVQTPQWNAPSSCYAIQVKRTDDGWTDEMIYFRPKGQSVSGFIKWSFTPTTAHCSQGSLSSLFSFSFSAFSSYVRSVVRLCYLSPSFSLFVSLLLRFSTACV